MTKEEKRILKHGPELLKALVIAIGALEAIYEIADKTNELGGATSVNGLASCHAFLRSLKRNKARIKRDIIDSGRAAVAGVIGEKL